MQTTPAEKAPKSRRPANTPFKQQNLKAWRPILTPKLVILLFLVVGIVFIPIGVVILVSSSQVVEIESKDYSECTTNPCEVEIDVTTKMKGRIFMYYKLTNYYQNHRRYVKSRSDLQLRGNEPQDKTSLADDCEYRYEDSACEDATADCLINPCGLIAWSYFNDSYVLKSPENVQVNVSETGIAWESDVEMKFRNSEDGTTGQNFPAFTWERNRTCEELPVKDKRCDDFAADHPESGWCYPNSGYCTEDEHFIVWMRTAGLPSFRKLWGIIDQDLPEGKYTISVSNGVFQEGRYVNPSTNLPQETTYPVSGFGGTKSIVLSTSSWLGGKNNFLGYAYVVVGVVCVVLAICFFIKDRLSPRELGNASYVTWKKDSDK